MKFQTLWPARLALVGKPAAMQRLGVLPTAKGGILRNAAQGLAKVID